MPRTADHGEGLRISRAQVEGGTLVRLSGIVDERLEKPRLIDGLRGTVVFDLSEVARITSYGVREWIKALGALQAEYCCFVGCRPALVSQFNMVANFGGRGELLTFYAPYVCDHCGHAFDVLVDLRTQHADVKNLLVPKSSCPECRGEATFDDIPDSYLSYVAGAPAPSPPPLVEVLLRSAPGGTPLPFRIDKEVVETVTLLWLSGNLDQGASFKRLADGLEGDVIVMLDGVGEVDPEGVKRLAGFLAQADPARIYLARVTRELALQLGADPKRAGSAAFLSFRTVAHCPHCRKPQAVDVDVGSLALLAAERPVELPCLACGGSLAVSLDRAFLEAARKLPLVKPPESAPPHLKRSRPARPAAPPSAGEEKTPSEIVFGRYHLLRPLGIGGMAEVFLARQTGAGGFEKNVVVKRILPHLSSDQAFITMFLQEARLAARISHPNVVQIFDLGEVGRRYFIAMEYVRGWDLNAVLRLCARLNAPVPVELAARIASDVCGGLQAAHTCVDDQGKSLAIVHRDVSPHNILLSADGQVKITDFGIAKAIDSGKQTPTSTLKGKLAYMAPEQVRTDAPALDARLDLFPTGVILYQLLTFEHPFRRETEYATLRSILHDPLPRVSTRRPEAPPQLEEILDRAMAKGPEARYQTARDFQENLEHLLASLGKPAGARELAAWLKELMERAQAMGELPPELAFTPTGNLPVSQGVTLPTVPAIRAKDETR